MNKRTAFLMAPVVAVAIACGSGAAKSDDDKFRDTCRAQGGIPHTVDRSGRKARVCEQPGGKNW